MCDIRERKPRNSESYMLHITHTGATHTFTLQIHLHSIVYEVCNMDLTHLHLQTPAHGVTCYTLHTPAQHYMQRVACNIHQRKV